MTVKQVTTSLKLCQLQAMEEDGEWKISGYATVFGNRNSYGFQIRKGAYSKVLAEGVNPKMFFNHDSWNLPIGKWTDLKEDEIGLKVEGVLTKGVSKAEDIYHAVKAGTVDGLSVGIGWKAADEVELDDGTVEVTMISRLSEISVVTYPSDGKARVTQVLSADEVDEKIESLQSVRDLENFFHDEFQLSKRQSGWLLSKAKACFAAEKSRDDSQKAQKELAAVFDRLSVGIDKLS